MTNRPARHHATTAAAAVSAVLLTLLTGCNSERSQAAAPVVKTASPTPSHSPAQDPQAVAAKQAIAAYLSYQQLYETAAQKADERIAGLDKYASGQALFEARHAMRVNRIDGVVQRGRDTFRPRVTQVLLDHSPKRVVISDCIDGSVVQLVNRRTGKTIQIVDPQGRPTKVRRHPAVAWVEYVNGGWFVTHAPAARPEKSC